MAAPVYQLVGGVGGGEAVVDDIPVAVVVLRVETGKAERGGVGHGTGQLFGTGPLLLQPGRGRR